MYCMYVLDAVSVCYHVTKHIKVLIIKHLVVTVFNGGNKS